jgi:hypothetical protein
MMFLSINIKTMGATSGVRTTYPSRSYDVSPFLMEFVLLNL